MDARRLLASVAPEVVGQRLRRARLRQGLSVRDLAEQAQVSKTSVVKVEQGGIAQPKTVVAICGALGLHLAGLVASEPEEQLAATHFSSDDVWYDMTAFGSGPLQTDGKLDRDTRNALGQGGLEVALLYLKNRLPGGRILPALLEVYHRSESRSHAGEEMIYCLEGEGFVYVGAEEIRLRAGECVTFWSAEEHSYAPVVEGEPVRFLSMRIDYQRGE